MTSVMQNIAVTLVLFSICFASEHEPSKNNREIFFRLCDSAMVEIVSAGINQQMPVTLQTGNDIISSYFHHRFIQGLSLRNIPTYLKTDSAMTTLELTVRESSVFYGEVFTESFFGERKTERKLTLSLNATFISNSNGKVISAVQVSKTFTDTVAYSAVEQFNEQAPPLSGYVRPALTFFDSILEPAIVTIASGVAIYLFFTIRS